MPLGYWQFSKIRSSNEHSMGKSITISEPMFNILKGFKNKNKEFLEL